MYVYVLVLDVGGEVIHLKNKCVSVNSKIYLFDSTFDRCTYRHKTDPQTDEQTDNSSPAPP